ncbi:MAG: hypothetical protein ACTHLE_11510 [Agriterribacter sp.]
MKPNMSINAYREKLLNKILKASSAYEVERYIQTAIKAFNASKVNGYITSRFIDKTLYEIALLQRQEAGTQAEKKLGMAIEALQMIKSRCLKA